MEDIPYHKHSEQEFSDALLQCEERMRESGFKLPLTHEVSNFRRKWFRPPQGRCSSQMRKVLHEQGYTIAMCDVFGMDTHCGEPYVSSYVLKHVKDGSVLLMHMPEMGFREHNLEAIQVRSSRGLRVRVRVYALQLHVSQISV